MFKWYQGEFQEIIKNGGRVCLRESEGKNMKGSSRGIKNWDQDVLYKRRIKN